MKRQRTSQCAAAVLFAAFALLQGSAHAREEIRIVGSSTVYPFAAAAAEQFGKAKKFKTPIVESTGTGGGFKLFCSGVGDNTPDISNASRAILKSEIALCKKNGVTGIAEIAIGYDGIVLVNKKGAPAFDVSKKQIFMALARQTPGVDGKLSANRFTRWSEIDPKLPDQPIEVYGPPPTSGTRDAFVELVMEKGCDELPAFAAAYPDEKERRKACGMLREDGRYIEAGEDDNLIVQKIAANADAIGIAGYSFYEENRGKVQAARVGGVAPDYDTIEKGDYSVSRSLYAYVKKQHVGKVPGIAEFVRELTGEAAIGEDGYLIMKGLLPLTKEERLKVQAVAKQL